MSTEATGTTIRFEPDLAAAAKSQASREGLSLSEWIRKLADQEIARREGRCPSCGKPTEET